MMDVVSVMRRGHGTFSRRVAHQLSEAQVLSQAAYDCDAIVANIS
jgi:hypothetical protein